MRKVVKCPFCEGDINGCCFCDHSGRIYVGEGELFKTEQQVNESLGIKFLKETDKNGGTEVWPEMIEYFLNDNHVPKWFKSGLAIDSTTLKV